VRIIKRNGDHLLTIINDILDLSKIEAGKLEIELEQMSPLALFADIVSLMRVRADAKSLALKLQYRGPLPQTIQTDSARLRQIIVNLLGNAIKFTELGEVRLIVQLLDRDTQEPKLQCSVLDTGHGIAPEQLPRLFQPFQQADSSTTRTFGGTGLGLAISKRLALALGGDITVDTASGEGSTFTLTVATGSLEGVPLLERPSESVVSIQANTPAKPAPKMLLNYRILLAEDGADNQRLISMATYPGGGRRFDDPTEPFDVVLMDMQMPVMDGYEATRRLRAEGYTRPVLALTAHAMKDDMQKCLVAGCDEYLTKPIVRDTFLDTVARWAARAGAEAAPPESSHLTHVR
jgi:CheY-like chemotaxis protein